MKMILAITCVKNLRTTLNMEVAAFNAAYGKD